MDRIIILKCILNYYVYKLLTGLHVKVLNKTLQQILWNKIYLRKLTKIYYAAQLNIFCYMDH
jgi:hypothetical protein